ncbi:MAG: BTAD domain-containing putative transcriptional regulator [Caldilineaceae bacterium]
MKLQLLGTPQATLHGQRLTGFITSKAEALFYYLAVTGRVHTRAFLATILWPDMAENRARKNLRDVISNLRKLVGDYLIISRHDLAFNQRQPYWLDVELFSTGLSAPNASLNDLREAIGLYKGEFLESFQILNAAPFEVWVQQQRAEYHSLVINALQTLADRYSALQAYESALTATRRLLLLEPWNEEAHRKQMLFLAQSGQRTAALAQYQSCVQVLADELAVTPMSETTALYRQISETVLVDKTKPATEAESATAYRTALLPLPNNLPRQLTPMIGRTQEIATIRSKLLDPHYPLVTIVGEGGIGKTRLAQAIAYSLLESEATAQRHLYFADGVWFVSLLEAKATDNLEDQLAFAISEALRLPLLGDSPFKAQLFERLRKMRLLLILDNFEHVVAGAGFLLELLQSVYGAKVLVTARRRLNLQAEHLYRLEGLATPTAAEGKVTAKEQLLKYESFQLFIERATRVASGFTLTDENQADVAAICHAVGGLPLGIELAAALTEEHDVKTIAQQLQHNYAILATSLADLPSRHRTMQAVLDYSWQLLSPTESAVLAACAVFHGGFSGDAALAVADTTSGNLSALVEHSLLHRTRSDRFELHELIRQYALAKLEQQVERAKQVHERHYAYYFQQIQQWTNAPNQAKLQRTLRNELDNIRAAWRWASNHIAFETLAESGEALFRFYDALGLYREGYQLMEQSVAYVRRRIATQADSGGQNHSQQEHATRTLAMLLLTTAAMQRWLGQPDSALQLTLEGLQLAHASSAVALLARGYIVTGDIRLLYHDLPAALTAYETGLAYARQSNATYDEIRGVIGVGQIFQAQQDLAVASTYYQSALELAWHLQNDKLERLALTNLANFYKDANNWSQALQLAHSLVITSRTAREWVTTMHGAALMGECYSRLGQFQQAQRYLQQALQVAQELAIPYHQANLYLLITNNYLAQEDFAAALAAGEAGIQIATKVNLPTALCETKLAVARTLIALQRWTEAKALLKDAMILAQQLHLAVSRAVVYASLAEIALHQEAASTAKVWCNLLLQFIAENQGQMREDWLLPYWVGYSVLHTLHDVRAGEILENAHTLLVHYAAKIEDEVLKQSFLENIAVNRAIMHETCTTPEYSPPLTP